MNNCFCIENYVNKIKGKPLGKIDNLRASFVSFSFLFFGALFPSFTMEKHSVFFRRKNLWHLKAVPFVEALNFWHAHISHHIHLNFRSRLGSLGQFTYVLCAHPTSTLDKFKHFLRAIKAVYFMLNILNPRNNTTNCSPLFFHSTLLVQPNIHTRDDDVRMTRREISEKFVVCGEEMKEKLV